MTAVSEELNEKWEKVVYIREGKVSSEENAK